MTLSEEVRARLMGPPNAEAALREAVALGVTRAVLLRDRLLAGSDTWATSDALAAAICQLDGADLVFCGISALDGETGPVGPEVAARLGRPQATACESLLRTVEGNEPRLCPAGLHSMQASRQHRLHRVRAETRGPGVAPISETGRLKVR